MSRNDLPNFSRSLSELKKKIGKDENFDPKIARNDIGLVISSYNEAIEETDKPNPLKQRPGFYQDMLKNVRELREGYEKALSTPILIDPLVWAWGDPDWDHVESLSQKFLQTLQVQEKWIESASRHAANPRGRPKSSGIPGLSKATIRMAGIWQKYTGKKARLSRPPYGGTPFGPFIRFVVFAFEDASVEVASKNFPEYIAKSLKGYDALQTLAHLLDPEEKFGPLETNGLK